MRLWNGGGSTPQGRISPGGRHLRRTVIRRVVNIGLMQGMATIGYLLRAGRHLPTASLLDFLNILNADCAAPPGTKWTRFLSGWTLPGDDQRNAGCFGDIWGIVGKAATGW